MWRLFPGAARTTWEHLLGERDDHKSLWKLVKVYKNAYWYLIRLKKTYTIGAYSKGCCSMMKKVDAKLGFQLFKWQLFLSANVSTTPPSELSAARGKSGLNSTLLHWVFKSLAKALFAQGVHSLGKPKHFHHFVTFTPNINTNQTVCCFFCIG